MKRIVNYFVCHNNLHHEVSEKNGKYHFEIHDNGNVVHSEECFHKENIMKKFMDRYKDFFLKQM